MIPVIHPEPLRQGSTTRPGLSKKGVADEFFFCN